MEKKRYIKMNVRGIYTVPSISIPFPTFHTRTRRLSLVLSLTTAQCLLPVLGALKSGWETQRKNKMADSLPAHLILPLTFPSTLYIFRVTIKGEGNGHSLQYSCLENPMDRGAWRAVVHGVARVGHDLATKPLPPP